MVSCPSCRAPVSLEESQSAEECAGCGLTLASLDSKCGVVPMIRKRAYSPTGQFTQKDAKVLNRAALRFERMFPQVQLAIVAMDIPAPVSAREYGFWLLNRGRFFTAQKTPGKNFSVLLLIDTRHESFAITLGYGLEQVLSAEALESVLAAGVPLLQRGQFRRAAMAAIDRLNAHLRAAAGGGNS